MSRLVHPTEKMIEPKNIVFSSCKKQEASTCNANVSKVKEALHKEALIKAD